MMHVAVRLTIAMMMAMHVAACDILHGLGEKGKDQFKDFRERKEREQGREGAKRARERKRERERERDVLWPSPMI